MKKREKIYEFTQDELESIYEAVWERRTVLRAGPHDEAGMNGIQRDNPILTKLRHHIEKPLISD